MNLASTSTSTRARPNASLKQAGFTLLEVMIAVAILGVGLSAIFSSEVQSAYTAAYARDANTAALLARCKMGEIEEQVLNQGFPAIDDSGEDGCCDDAEVDGFTCEWSIDRIVLPEGYLEEEAGDDGLLDDIAEDQGAQAGVLDSMLSGGGLGLGGGGGFAEMAISIAFPIMKPAIEEQVRRATVTVKWDHEGASRSGSFDVVQYLVAEQASPTGNDDAGDGDPDQ